MLLAASLSFVLTLLLFELAYRYQVIDFYRPELVTFNSYTDPNRQTDTHPLLLFFGVSFTAGNQCYVQKQRNGFGESGCRTLTERKVPRGEDQQE